MMCVLEPRGVFVYGDLAVHKQPHNAIHARHGTSWRFADPPPCLGGSSHRWVPVNTHSAPVPLRRDAVGWLTSQPLAHTFDFFFFLKNVLAFRFFPFFFRFFFFLLAFLFIF